jgi:TFIIF-interacting CTD phosphatase-like protein
MDTAGLVRHDVKEAYEKFANEIRAIWTAKQEGKIDVCTILPKASLVERFCTAGKKLLVLDIDGTLAFHRAEEAMPIKERAVKFYGRIRGPDSVRGDPPQSHFVWLRPNLQAFLEKCHRMYDLVAFSSSRKEHVKLMMDCIDPKLRYIKCVFAERHTSVCRIQQLTGNWVNVIVKDLTFLLGRRDLKDIVIIDNNVVVTAPHLENTIPIHSYEADAEDHDLENLIPFLEELASAPDVREPIRARYGSAWQHIVQNSDGSKARPA